MFICYALRGCFAIEGFFLGTHLCLQMHGNKNHQREQGALYVNGEKNETNNKTLAKKNTQARNDLSIITFHFRITSVQLEPLAAPGPTPQRTTIQTTTNCWFDQVTPLEPNIFGPTQDVHPLDYFFSAWRLAIQHGYQQHRKAGDLSSDRQEMSSTVSTHENTI